MAEDLALLATLEKEKAEQSHKELGKPIEFSPFNMQEPRPVPGDHLSDRQSRNDTDSESKDDGDDQVGTSPLSNVTSATSQCDSSGSPEVHRTPPHMPLFVQDSDDPVRVKVIEESDAELIVSSTSFRRGNPAQSYLLCRHERTKQLSLIAPK